jgi:hypothetical protein
MSRFTLGGREMRKHITIALAGLFAVAGLTVAPPSASGTHGTLAGSVTLYGDPDFGGDQVVIQEAQIPSACTAIPAGVTTVRSAQNNTNSPGTSVSFYTSAGCATLLATVGPGMSNRNINNAQFWRVTP